MENKVELCGVYGSDLTHACSAWTSTNRSLTPGKLGRVDALIDMLMGEGHHTPFEKSALHFLVTTDIATHIHLLKHRIGVSINAESARYKELGRRKTKKGGLSGEDKYYLPVDWQKEDRDELRLHIEECYKRYHSSIRSLRKKGYSQKRAKESARFYLPYSTQITADILFNFRSFLHFQILRNSEHAQVEVRVLSQKMRELIEVNHPEFRGTLAAFDSKIERERVSTVCYAVLDKFNLLEDGITEDVLTSRLGLSEK